nr:Chain B, DNA mismatch repair protein Mlh1 [Homo sapiens]6WBA_C Chain C, DNA mismatch repair protein Mlh1 [Homo sapiens]
SSNPAKRHRED